MIQSLTLNSIKPSGTRATCASEHFLWDKWPNFCFPVLLNQNISERHNNVKKRKEKGIPEGKNPFQPRLSGAHQGFRD